jgi:hypothetical protein
MAAHRPARSGELPAPRMGRVFRRPRRAAASWPDSAGIVGDHRRGGDGHSSGYVAFGEREDPGDNAVPAAVTVVISAGHHPQ